jgi:hypothetical protein
VEGGRPAAVDEFESNEVFIEELEMLYAARTNLPCDIVYCLARLDFFLLDPSAIGVVTVMANDLYVDVTGTMNTVDRSKTCRDAIDTVIDPAVFQTILREPIDLVAMDGRWRSRAATRRAGDWHHLSR